MNIYEKPMLVIESLEAEAKLANDDSNLGGIDPLANSGEEVSITVPDSWFDY